MQDAPPAYKARVQAELEARSAKKWRAEVAIKCPDRPFLAACPFPICAADTFMAMDDLEAARAAHGWACLRLGITPSTGPAKLCALCGAGGGSLGHLARACPELVAQRELFLLATSAARRRELQGQGNGGWALSVFSVVGDPADLRANVFFGAAIHAALTS